MDSVRFFHQNRNTFDDVIQLFDRDSLDFLLELLILLLVLPCYRLVIHGFKANRHIQSFAHAHIAIYRQLLGFAD